MEKIHQTVKIVEELQQPSVLIQSKKNHHMESNNKITKLKSRKVTLNQKQEMNTIVNKIVELIRDKHL